MARFTIKAFVVAALVCLVIDLAATLPTEQLEPQVQVKQSEGYVTVAEVPVEKPTTTPGSFKDKFKGFVSSVKVGASDAYDSVSDSVSGAAHKLDEKRKEALAGTKKLVNGVVDKIKEKYDSFNHSSEEDGSQSPYSDEEISIQTGSKNTKM